GAAGLRAGYSLPATFAEPHDQRAADRSAGRAARGAVGADRPSASVRAGTHAEELAPACRTRAGNDLPMAGRPPHDQRARRIPACCPGGAIRCGTYAGEHGAVVGTLAGDAGPALGAWAQRERVVGLDPAGAGDGVVTDGPSQAGRPSAYAGQSGADARAIAVH